MKLSNRKIAGALALAITGGGLFLGTTSALAASTPPWEPDANSDGYGAINFYDANGKQVTGGSNLNHLFDYAVAATASQRATTKATLLFGFPDHNKADTTEWYTVTAAGPTTFPLASAPGAVAAANGKPTVKVAANEANLKAAAGGAVLDTTAGYKDLVQVRLKDSGQGLPSESSFWATDIAFDSSAGTWSQVYPKVATSTSTAVTATPNPVTAGSSVTLSATVTGGGAGTVQFSDGSTQLNGPVTVSNGTASTTTSSLSAGSHTITATYTPSSTADYAASSGTTTLVVNPPATPTTTTLAVSGDYTTAGSAATLTANVTGPGSTPNGSGTVAFYDNGAASPIAGTVTSPSAGTYVLSVANGFAAGAHSVVAKFSPTDVTSFEASQSAAQAFTTAPAQGSPCAQPGAQCTDPQPIQATVPVGTLVIDTPYTAASPLDLGTLALASDSSKFSGTATFNDIKVTDTRAGNLPWTAQALSSALSNGKGHSNSTINAQNVGLTGLQVTKGTGFTGAVTTLDNAVPTNPVAPADTGSAGLGGSAAHTIATADKGQGTVTLKGTLTVVAPSSTEAGLFTGTITFTVG